MKKIIQISILILSISCFSQSDKILKRDSKGFTIEKQNGERVGYKSLLVIKIDDLKKQPIMFQNIVDPNEKDTLFLKTITLARKSFLGIKTKSKNGLSYDVQMMEYQSRDKAKTQIIYLDPKIIYNNQLTSNLMEYLTENNVNVSMRIQEGRTHFFEGVKTESRNKAEEKAKDVGSYVYDVFTRNEDNRKVQVGFAVPR